ncbi:MAG: mechanosensitive ion channel family protein [Anaerolineales bacterium]
MPPISQQLQEFINQFPDVLSRAILAIVIVIVAFILSAWLARIVAKGARQRKADATLQETLRRLVRWSTLALGLVLAAEQVIPNVTSLLAGLGIAGFTIGFALQDVAKNLIAGLLLMLQQPFDLGDNIEVAGFTGKVIGIELRTTDIRAIDGRFVTIPNADVLASPIINYSRAPIRRLEVSIPVAYGADLNRTRQVADQAIGQIRGLVTDPAPEITFRQLGDAYLSLVVQYWADMKDVEYNVALDEGIRALEAALAAEGIEIAPPASFTLTSSE